MARYALILAVLWAGIPTSDVSAAEPGSRRLPPHVLLDAATSATGVAYSFKDYPDIKKAIQLPSEQGQSDFLDMFGRSRRDMPCECETSVAPNLPQVLYLVNSDDLQRKLADKNGFVAELMKPGKTAPQIVEEMFLRTFSRPPRPVELKDATELIEKAANRRHAVEDIMWALLNSNEFLFDH